MAMKAYSCRSTSLLLVKGGSNSSIGAGVLRPLSPNCEHNVRRIRARVARSDKGSGEGTRFEGRSTETGISGLWRDSLLTGAGADGACEDILEVAWALERG